MVLHKNNYKQFHNNHDFPPVSRLLYADYFTNFLVLLLDVPWFIKGGFPHIMVTTTTKLNVMIPIVSKTLLVEVTVWAIHNTSRSSSEERNCLEFIAHIESFLTL